MKRATLIALIASLLAPGLSFADPGHPMLYEAYEVLHYFTSIHHLLPTALVIGVVIGLTFGVKRFLARKKQSIR